MYTTINFKSKKALKDAIKAGRQVTVYQPGIGDTPSTGAVALEGPHYPEPHKWYAQADIANGVIVKVH